MATEHNSRPNLLVILSDQLRRHALGCYGDTNVMTPNVDRLAREGVCCSAAYATYPVCVPFRFTMMTGEYAHSRWIAAIGDRMSPVERTLADEFNAAGYDTAYIGKWHLYGGHGRHPWSSARIVGRTAIPREHQGRWTHWRGFELRNDPYDTYYFVDDDPTPRPIEGYQTDGLCDVAMEWLTSRAESSKPFCMIVSVEPPHPPFVAPPELEAKWRDRELDLPPNFEADSADARKALLERRRMYYAMVENLDENVGRLMSFLERQELKDDTNVVLVSDHGETAGSHGVSEKQHPYEESVGIPFIVAGPAVRDAAGTVIDEPIATEDLFPTFLGLCGLESGRPLPGLDATPVMRGDLERLPREGILLEFVDEQRPGFVYHNATWRSFRSRRYKYTVLGDASGGEPWTFFDLDNDPFEQKNLLDCPDCRQELERHHALLMKALRESGDDYALKPAFGLPGMNQRE